MPWSPSFNVSCISEEGKEAGLMPDRDHFVDDLVDSEEEEELFSVMQKEGQNRYIHNQDEVGGPLEEKIGDIQGRGGVSLDEGNMVSVASGVGDNGSPETVAVQPVSDGSVPPGFGGMRFVAPDKEELKEDVDSSLVERNDIRKESGDRSCALGSFNEGLFL
ncbi:hypothetical protein L1987_42479 [Smallanthus sonchifolius]|uniref:Uncharacterized protein n=1 Tax=Smallanthus sonchifolius TaxID=185202 RepID=A0ACB9GIS5_9ASTR|nr:hypothetical protein L1987_42479 [Smallanthus sonchifolius]